MSWANALLETYENNVGKYGEEKRTLAPISHTYVNVQLELTLNGDGEFVSAVVVDRENAVTLIPVSEKSASRASGVAAHPLCDTLSYIAGDYSLYCRDKKEAQKSKEKYDAYMRGLSDWVKSDYAIPKVKAIFDYLNKRELISDLIKSGIITLGSDNKLDNRKISGNPYDKALVRFRVVGLNESEECVWKDKKLMGSYSQYYQNNQSIDRQTCYVTGKLSIPAKSHPKGIVAASFNAKLVSANDNTGFTYRGRFIDPDETCVVGYDTSQKIHAALSWLVANQGVTQSGRTYIAWNPGGKPVPNLFTLFDTETETEGSLNPDFRRKLKVILRGYNEAFDDTDEVYFIGLDAATTGRLSITYYYENNARILIEDIAYWSETCNWFFPRWDDKKKLFYEDRTPPFWQIINCAFGTERDGRLSTDDRIFKEQIQRLIKCMLERQPFPRDIVLALSRRASDPQRFSHANRERILSTACAAIVKYGIDHKEKGGIEMELDHSNHNRSYLFGRLLAVMEKIERSTYRDENRDPNAIRLQAAFVNHPMQTWKILEQAITPYYQKHSPGSREYYRQMMSEIAGSFEEGDSKVMNKPLQEEYLLGYYLQRAELNKKRNNETDKEEE